ncbi:MAG: patatin-like phospholipase family protein [Clostridia bacterium]|nr:patatin-like phospholipase family protein [Clostridia bacterium]
MKCAYQLGFLRGLGELPRFDGVFGSSFGALGAALLIGGGLPALESFWEGLTAERIFGSSEATRLMQGLYANDRSASAAALLRGMAAYGLSTRGYADVSRRYLEFVKGCVDERAVRASGVELGICVSEIPASAARRNMPGFLSGSGEDGSGASKCCPVYLALDDIPEGRLPDHVAASACFPAFLPAEIDGRLFIDGGVCDNAPVKMAYESGYANVLCIRTNRISLEPAPAGVELKCAVPSRELGSCAVFARENIDELIILGERDAEIAVKEGLAPFYR